MYGHGIPDGRPALPLNVTGGSGPGPRNGGGGTPPAQIVLRDGTPALIRPLLASDRAALREGFAGLSDRSRYRRFLSPTPELTERMLGRLVDDVDGVDHVALILVALPPGGDERPVGVGRLIRYANDRTAADIAITVVDRWQGRGVGTALVEAVLARRPDGVTRLRTLTAADNVASLAMLRAAGPVTTRMEQGVVEVRVDLPTRTTRRSTPGSRSHPTPVDRPAAAQARAGEGSGTHRQQTGTAGDTAASPRFLPCWTPA